MGPTVYVRSYVRGPEQDAAAIQRRNHSVWQTAAQTLRHVKLRLTPRVQKRACPGLLILETATAALASASALAALLGAGRAVVVCLISGATGLALLLLVAAVKLAWGDYKRQLAAMRPRQVLSPLAFRIVNPSQDFTPEETQVTEMLETSDHGLLLQLEAVESNKLQAGDKLLVEAGQFIHADGVILCGTAVVDEAVTTGESSGVIREADGARDVMRDSLVVMGRLIVQVGPRRGHPLDWIVEPGSAALNRASDNDSYLPLSRR
jgi:high-affinity K+ transport system ATPase subunit B